MPIRLNLFAEAQAAEEMRRRDPVKRAIFFGTLLVALMLVWSGSLQLKVMFAKNELSRVELQIGTRSNDFQLVITNQKKSAEITDKLLALRQLAANRFLNGTMLNALQQTVIEDVQLSRLRAEQFYNITEETKPRTNSDRIVPGKPATITEKIVLTLEARDSAPTPGDQINKFKEAVASHPYFRNALGNTNKVNLGNWLPAQAGLDGRQFVLFTLECRYPEKTR